MNSLFSFIILSAKKYRFKSVFSKTFFIIVCILLIPITAFNVLFYFNNEKTLEKEFDIINTHNLNSTKSIIESTIRETEYYAIQTSLHPDIENFLFASENDKKFSEIQKNIQEYTKQFVYIHSYINSVYVFSEKSNVVGTNSESISYKKQEDSSWREMYEKMDMNETCIFPRKYAGRHPKLISIIRTVGIPAVGKTGCVVVNIDVEKLNEEVFSIGEQKNIYKFYVVNTDGEVLYTNILSDQGIKYKTTSAPEKDSYISSETVSEKYGWKYVSLMQNDSIAATKNSIFYQTVTSMLIMILLAVVVAALISVWLFRPFQDILGALNHSYGTDYEINPKFSKNEVGLIINSIKEDKGKYFKIEAELQRRIEALNKAQVVALQSQINPHFINNMLEITNWTAIDLIGKSNRVSEMLKVLSNLLLIGLDFENYLIPIEEELHHIDVYSHLVSLGYEEQFRLKLDMEPGIEDYKIIKLTLQPILENAVHHGVGQNDESIEVYIKGEILEEDILFTISDNGIGIAPEKLKIIQDELLSGEYFKKNRIGLNNVNNRIRLVCGVKYGLTVDSTPGKGTTVKMRIPKIQNEADGGEFLK